ncbi:hypothetical protein [Aminobacterium sp. UBA5514]|uniref:hypothetical protein n=1 Tax=Aminobacterium sp. UBA5514 TaxID=1946036 RepID=UPI00257DFE04|nr:hypothetical protein [Aminobacterium sp. UBA5514]
MTMKINIRVIPIRYWVPEWLNNCPVKGEVEAFYKKEYAKKVKHALEKREWDCPIKVSIDLIENPYNDRRSTEVKTDCTPSLKKESPFQKETKLGEQMYMQVKIILQKIMDEMVATIKKEQEKEI